MALTEQALAAKRWAAAARKETASCPSIDGSDAAKERAVTRMRRYLKAREERLVQPVETARQ